MSDEIKQAVEAVNQIGKAFEEFKSANDAKLKEIEAKGAADPVTEAKLAKIEADMTKLQAVADDAVLAVKRSQRIVTDQNGNQIDMDAKAADWARFVGSQTKQADEAKGFNASAMAEYKKSFDRLVRLNFDHTRLSEAERKALSVGTDTDGGFFVHPDLSGRMVKKIFETSPVRAYASVQVISTDALEGYYDNNEVGFGWVSELASRPATTTPAVGAWRIPVHEMYAMPEASQKILDDAEVDMEAWLAAKIADKFARAENAAFVSGNGIGKPRGFLDYPDGSDLTNSVTRFKTGVDGAFAAAPNGGDALINALYDLKAEYRANATWFMNRAVTALVRKLKDSDGAYLWQPGIAAGQPATILGHAVASFEDMPTPVSTVAGTLGIAVGDLRQAYQVVDRMGVRMLRDPYSAKPKVQFYATKRTGGDLLNGEALKFVVFSA
jgi:HK97 family phage major capsid protein